MQVIDRLMPIIEGKAKSLNYFRPKPAAVFFNRVNLLNKLLNKVDDITNEYYLKLYLPKWRQNVEDIKDKKRKKLLSFIKKKIKDEREISNNRKAELLKRILDRDNKRILNKFRQALKIWALVAKVSFIIDNGEIKTIDGKKVEG